MRKTLKRRVVATVLASFPALGLCGLSAPVAAAPAQGVVTTEAGSHTGLIQDLFIDQLPFGQPGDPVSFSADVHSYEATAFYHTDEVTVRAIAASGAQVAINGKSPDADGRATVDVSKGATITVTGTSGGKSASYTITVHKVNTDFRGNVFVGRGAAEGNGATAAENASMTDGDPSTGWKFANFSVADDWSSDVSGFQLHLPQARYIAHINATADLHFVNKKQDWDPGYNLTLQIQESDDAPWTTISTHASLRSMTYGGIIWWDLGGYHKVKNVRVWMNPSKDAESIATTALTDVTLQEFEFWGLPDGKEPPKTTVSTAETEAFDPATVQDEWGVNRPQALALHYGILLPAWVPSEGYARATMDDREQKLTGGVIPVFYDPPLFNESMMASLENTQWGIAKAPYGKNSMTGSFEDFLTAEQKQYAAGLVDIQYGDEGGWSLEEQARFKDWFAGSKAAYPGAIVHSNQYGGGWSGHIADYVTDAQPDLVSWDGYQFAYGDSWNQAPSDVVRNHFNGGNWKEDRQAALGVGLDGEGQSPTLYGQFIDYQYSSNVPESEKALTVMLSLASGQKWIGGFRMENNGYDNGGLYDHDGAPTPTFYEFTRIFQQVRGMGNYLVGLNNTYVATVPGSYSAGTTNSVASGWKMGDFAGSPKEEYGLIDVSARNVGTQNDGRPGDVVLGYFDKVPGLKAGKTAEIFGAGVTDPKAFMVVNGLVDRANSKVLKLATRTDDGSYWQTAQEITLTVAPPTADATLMMVDPVTFKATEVTPVPVAGKQAATVKVALGGGQGALFYWTAPNRAQSVSTTISAFHPTVTSVDSEETVAEPDGRENMVDGTDTAPNFSTFWHTPWGQGKATSFPHYAVFGNLPVSATDSRMRAVDGVVFSPRQVAQWSNGVDSPQHVSYFAFDEPPTTAPDPATKTWAGGTKLADATYRQDVNNQVTEFTAAVRPKFIGMAVWDNCSGSTFTSVSDIRLLASTPQSVPWQDIQPATPVATPTTPAATSSSESTSPAATPSSTPGASDQPSAEPSIRPSDQPSVQPSRGESTQPPAKHTAAQTGLARTGSAAGVGLTIAAGLLGAGILLRRRAANQ